MPLGFIFLDMDETLGFFRNYDGSMNDEGFANGIYLRANVKQMLEMLHKDFLLFVTTAATVSYTKVVLEHSDLAKYFHGIFTRRDFVKLEHEGDANKEASPGGYEKRYSLIMKNYGIKMEQAGHGLVIGDNDYDTSCDVPGLRTLIVDSLFVDANLVHAIIMDIFTKKELNYKEHGLNIFKKEQKHPIAELISESIEVECLVEEFQPSELEQVPVELTDEEKVDMKVKPEEEQEIKEGIQVLEAEQGSQENLGDNIVGDDEKLNELLESKLELSKKDSTELIEDVVEQHVIEKKEEKSKEILEQKEKNKHLEEFQTKKRTKRKKRFIFF